MKRILLIGTGGTIASEMTSEGLSPELTPAQLLRYVPAVEKLCRVDFLSLFSIDSTNITPAHWLSVAAALRENYDRYDGFVISHGTDTMAYTAAALSYLVQGRKSPSSSPVPKSPSTMTPQTQSSISTMPLSAPARRKSTA